MTGVQTCALPISDTPVKLVNTKAAANPNAPIVFVIVLILSPSIPFFAFWRFIFFMQVKISLSPAFIKDNA